MRGTRLVINTSGIEERVRVPDLLSPPGALKRRQGDPDLLSAPGALKRGLGTQIYYQHKGH